MSMSVYPHSSSKAALTGNGSPMSDLELSVVIPCYNEEDVLPELYRRVTDVFMELGRSYEVIIVNDGSHDRTWPVLVGLTAEDPAHRRRQTFAEPWPPVGIDGRTDHLPW